MTRLNPGIRRLVALLGRYGFRTADSGDGETHDHACDRSYGYVVVLTDPHSLADETDRLRRVLEQHGIAVVAMAMEPPGEGQCTVQATYCPVDKLGVIDVSHVHDRMLAGGLADLLLAVAAQARRKALEEAARVCDELADSFDGPDLAAAAIRRLTAEPAPAVPDWAPTGPLPIAPGKVER